MDDSAQCYAFSCKNEAEAFDAVITSTILFCDRMANMLFNMGSTYSYMSINFVSYFEILCDVLMTLYMFLPRLESQPYSPMSIMLALSCL